MTEARPAWMDAFDIARKPDPTVAPVIPIITPDDTPAYARAALDRETTAVRHAHEGTRNHTLNSATFSLAQLVASGVLDEMAVRMALLEAALAAGLPRREAEKTIASGFRGGSTQPRDLSGVRELAAPSVTDVDAAELVTVGEAVDDAGQVWETFTGSTAPEAPHRTTWWPAPVEQLANQQDAAPTPDVLVRLDGVGLAYPGKVNGLLGESESGKTWVALHAVAQVAATGYPVLILDFEDTATTTRERLTALGAHAEAIERVYYAGPDQALDSLASADLNEALVAIQPRLVVVDGLNAAMTLLTYDLNSNTDATAFFVKLLRPLAATGAAVLTIDHVPKNPEQRGKGGIGAQAKRAMMDGCAIRVEVADPFGRGQIGRLKLWVDKDRPGHVRGTAGGGKYAGTFILHSEGNSVRAEIEPPQIPGQWRPTRLMAAISDLLQNSGPMSKNRIELGVKGDVVRIREALQHLLNDGHIEVSDGPRRSLVCTLIRPYLEPVEEVPTDA